MNTSTLQNNDTTPIGSADTDEAQLKILASELVSTCPDMWEMARAIAKTLLLKHTGQTLEPDTVYWHRFTGAQASLTP